MFFERHLAKTRTRSIGGAWSLERNDNGETSRAGGARRVGCLASPRRRRARPAGARPDECAARAETGRGTSRAVRRDDPRSPSSRRFERATRFSKTTRGHLVGSVVSATRRTCSSDTVCCICASFSRLLWNIVGRSERAPRGEHSGAPASARQRAIRRQEKKPRQLARGSVRPPAQRTRRLGKKQRTRAEPSASSSQAVAKKELTKLYHCGSMFSRPTRFAAARITASESDSRSRVLGREVPSEAERRSPLRRAEATPTERPREGRLRRSRTRGPWRLRSRRRLSRRRRARSRANPAPAKRSSRPTSGRGRAARRALPRRARRSARAPALEPRRTSSARALREAWSGTTRRTERRTTTTPPNARRPDTTLVRVTTRAANEERRRTMRHFRRRRNRRRKNTTKTSSTRNHRARSNETKTTRSPQVGLPTRTGWTMIGSGVRRVSSGSTPSRPSARRRTRSTRRTRLIF